MIEFKNVTKKFKDGTIGIKNVNLEINKNQFVGIIGPNGSGKSTLARLINGLYEPSSGKVEVDGFNTLNKDKLFDIRKKVGFVFQNPDNQIVATTIEDEIAFGLENLELPPQEINRRIDSALDFINMISYKRRLTTNLSGGQKQLITFASILAMEPEYLVLDEPTSLIDIDGRKKIMNLLKKIKKKKTVLFITHFLEEVFIADKILVLKDGEVIFFDTPDKLLYSDNILDIIGFELPTYLKVAKKIGIKEKKLDYSNVIYKIKEKINENRN